MPTSEEIAADLRDRIRAGEFGSGAKLPRIPELEQAYNADHPTVRRALHALEREGVVNLTLIAVVATDPEGVARTSLGGRDGRNDLKPPSGGGL